MFSDGFSFFFAGEGILTFQKRERGKGWPAKREGKRSLIGWVGSSPPKKTKIKRLVLNPIEKPLFVRLSKFSLFLPATFRVYVVVGVTW